MQDTRPNTFGDRRRATPCRGLRLLVLVMMLAMLPARVTGSDARVLTPEEHVQWAAIGRVNVGGLKERATCTGTLVAPDMVLTAAHCVPLRALRPDAAEIVHFMAGWFREDYLAHRTAAAIHIHPDYRRETGTVGTLHADLALLVLSEPVPAEVVTPMPMAPMPGFADTIEIIAYSNRRPGAMERTGPCTGFAAGADTLAMTCPAESGNSGSPVLWNGPEGWSIVAVTVARNTGSGSVQSFGARIPDILFEMAGRERP